MALVRRWPRLVAAGVAGFVLGAAAFSAGALLLYGGGGFLSSAGFLVALTIVSAAAGVWVGAPDATAPRGRQVLGRWMFAIGAMVIASFVASFWLRSIEIQATPWAAPVALVFLLAEPAYAIGSLLAVLEARRRSWLGQEWYRLTTTGRAGAGRAGGVAVPALLGVGLGAALAGGWLIPSFPPGLVFLGLGLLLTGAGSLEMGFSPEAEEGSMDERVVLVTGVGDREQVGYAVAESFVGEGARVVVTSRGESVRERARGLGGDVLAVPADLADPQGAAAVVAAARERWGRLDVVVNAAGGLHVTKSVEDTTPEDWQREVDANARTAFLVSRAALPLLRESRGAIINFASPAGLSAVGGMAAYSAGKAGVVALTRALAKEEKGRVRVNAIAPGMIDTAQNRAAVDDPERVEWVTRAQVSSVVLFLAGDASSGVTGETVRVLGRGV